MKNHRVKILKYRLVWHHHHHRHKSRYQTTNMLIWIDYGIKCVNLIAYVIIFDHHMHMHYAI